MLSPPWRQKTSCGGMRWRPRPLRPLNWQTSRPRWSARRSGAWQSWRPGRRPPRQRGSKSSRPLCVPWRRSRPRSPRSKRPRRGASVASRRPRSWQRSRRGQRLPKRQPVACQKKSVRASWRRTSRMPPAARQLWHPSANDKTLRCGPVSPNAAARSSWHCSGRWRATGLRSRSQRASSARQSSALSTGTCSAPCLRWPTGLPAGPWPPWPA